jgi:Tfp pilus assembly protein PilN
MSRFNGQLYQHINFLPAVYLQQRLRRAARLRQGALLSAMILGIAVGVAQTWNYRRALTHQHQTMLDLLATTKAQLTEVDKLEQARTTLARQIEIHRELHQPINYTELLGTLAAHTPEAVSLRRLVVANEKVAVSRPATAEDAAKARAAGLKAPKTVTDSQWITRVELDGVAPSDIEVANFIGAVAGSRLFQNVKLTFSRQGVVRRTACREFQVRMEVPLDCQYRPSPEVAGAP